MSGNCVEDKQNSYLLSNKTLQQEIKALKSQITFYRHIIWLAPGNVYWKDKDGRILGCNMNTAQLLGYNSEEEVIGKDNHDLFSKKVAMELDKIDQEICSTGEEKQLEEYGPGLEHPFATYISKKVPLFNENKEVVGLLGISFDITDRKKKEEDLKIAKEKAEASSRAKSQFLAIMNHELRTPLSSIVGLANLLKKDKLPQSEKIKMITSIENCSHHLLNLVNDVLDFSRLETGDPIIQQTKVNIKKVADDICQLLRPLAEKKGLKLHSEVAESIPQFIISDARMLRHILINLVSNAIKFTQKGHITIQVKCLSENQSSIRLKISVIDTGIGIPADKLQIIFEPFLQLENAYTRSSSRNGTGLGLSIVKKLTLFLKGQLKVVSQLGKGSTFSFIGEFPVKETTLKTKKKKKPIIQTKNAFSPAPRILLVEDDPIIQYIHKNMLEELGAEVKIANCGDEAIKNFVDCDLIFMDISLPDINGFEVIQAIRKKSTQRIPIIALTVYTGREEKLACLNAGADNFASKPITLPRLKKLLSKHLQE